MPLPTRKKGEEKQAFVSRCMSELTKKGEGKDAAQRAAICHSRATQLSNPELSAMRQLIAKLRYE